MNKKTLFLVITLTAMLILVTSVNAATDNTNTSTTHSISEKTTTAEPVVKEVQKQERNPEKQARKNKQKITKENKTEKQTKKDSITINGRTYTEIVENEEVELDEIWDRNKDKIYFFNNCTFINEYMEVYNDIYINNSKVNCGIYFDCGEVIINNSIVNDSIDGLQGESSLIIENSVINGIVDVYGNKEVRNSTINHKFYADPETYIYDVILGKNGQLIGNVIGEPLDPSIKIDVNNLEELTNTINTATNDIENEYVITLNEGTYTGTTQNWNEGESTQKITINGNKQTINVDNQLNINSKNTIIIKNTTINTIINNYNPDLTIQDSTLQKEINNYNTLTLNNIKTNNNINNHNNLKIIGILNSTINNEGTLIIDENTIIGENYEINGNGKIYTNATQTINGNQTITNKNFKLGVTIPTTGNITLTNCQINAKITNNGNLTLQNCSLSNNNIIDSLIKNKGNFVINNCIVENNTGNGVVINSTGDLIFINSNVFNNTCAVISVPTTTETISVDVRNNSFIYNRGVLSLGKSYNAVVNINQNTFTNNSINSMFYQTNIEDNVLVNSSININNYNDNNVKANNRIISNTFNNTNVVSPFLKAYNNTFNGGSLNGSKQLRIFQCPSNYLEIYNNTFNNATLNIPCAIASSEGFVSSSSKEAMMNNSIHNNIFNGKTSQENVITLTFPEWNENTKIFNNTYIQTSINNSMTYEISPKLFVNDNITFNYQLNNPKNYDEDILEKVTYDIYIDDILYKANTQDNTIQFNTNGEHTITITPNISTTAFTRTVDVLPLSDVIITPDNYNKYISNGELTRVNEDDRVLFQGEFTDKGQIFIVTDDIVIDGRDAHFTNTTFTLEAQNVVIQNMNIENTNTNNPAISNSKRNNHILNNNITVINTEGKTTAIQSTAANTQIRNNIIYVDGPALDIDHNTGGTANTQAILIIGSNKNTVQNNTITVTTTQESEQFGTIEGITATGVTNTIITQNRVNVSNAKFSYGINMLSNVADNSITQNNITVTSYRYCDGIQVGNQATNIFIQENQINIYCHNTTPVDEEAISYGIIVINMQDGQLNSEIYIDNNNINIDSTVGYGIEIYKTNSTEIRSNTINVKGLYSMGIGFAHSPTPAITANFLTTRVQANNITIIGDSTQKIRGVTEEIQPANIGIQIQQNSTNIKINDGYSWGYGSIGPNIIHTYDKGGQDYCINVESEGANIGGNELVCSNGVGNKAIKNTTTMTLEYNAAGIIYTNIEMNLPSETIINTTIPITISLRDEYNKTIGQVWEYDVGTMTITLTIDNQNTTLNIKDETITYNYTPNNTGTIEITATFNGVLTYNATTTTKTLTVNPKPESHTNITTENITLGETTTLTATFIDDNDQLITSGKVIFKVNGKTIRDNNGNVIYAEIVGGQATLPNVNITQEWMKPDTTIQSVYIGDDNNNPITTKPTTVTVTKPEATITLEAPAPATAGTKITLKATVTDGENNITSGRVAFKLNGKTLKDSEGKALYAEVKDGLATIQYTIPEKTKAKTYNLTAVFTDTAYDRVEVESKLKVVKA